MQMTTFGVPNAFLHGLLLVPVLSVDVDDALSLPMNTEHKLGASLEPAGQVASRQTKCSNPAWIPACPGPLGCIPPGASCCGTQYYFYPATEFCCAGGIGSCTLGTTCCGASYCCKAGATCSGGECVRPTTTTAESRTSTTTTSRTTSTETEACTIDVEVEKRAASLLPTMTVPYQETYTTLPGTRQKVCLDNRELMHSMCKGIKKAKGCYSTTMRLTFKPDLGDKNRQAMCGGNPCLAYNSPCDSANPAKPCNPYENFMNIPSKQGAKWRMSCDEFPFAKSAQGGKGTAICIPGWQNSYQGGKLNQLGIKVGDGNDYIIKVEGWDCRKGVPFANNNCGMSVGIPRVKRATAETTDFDSFTQEDLFTNFTATGEHALMMFLGDVEPGTYTYQLAIGTVTLTDVRAIDGDGDTVGVPAGNLKAATDKQTVTIQVGKPAYDVALWAFTRDTKLSVSYNVTYSQATSSPSPSSTTSPSMSGGRILPNLARVLTAAAICFLL